MDSRTDSFSSSILPSRNFFFLGHFNRHHLLLDSKGTTDPHGGEVFDWVIFSDPFPLNDLETPTLFHCSSGSCFSPNTSLAPFFLGLSCFSEERQDLGSDHLLILLTVTFYLLFCFNIRPSFFNFQRACWDDSAFYFDSHCSSAEKYSSLSLFLCCCSLALNVANIFISFGCVKCPAQAWWSKVVSKRCKTFRCQ